MDIELTGTFVSVLAGLAIAMVYLMPKLIQKCGPDEAMIIIGLVPGGMQIVRSGYALVWPLINQKRSLSLASMTIEMDSQVPTITRNGVPLYVEAVAQVRVRSDEKAIATAARFFQGCSMAEVAHESLIGHLRAILTTMSVEELIESFDACAQRVEEESVADLSKVGLTVDFFKITEIRDEVGYLDTLAEKKTAEDKHSPAIPEA